MSMGALCKVLAAQGVVRQRSRPLRAQLHFHCPKFTLALENRKAASPNRAGGVGPQLMVAAKELHCTVLAGSQESDQLQSGVGPLSVQVAVSTCMLDNLKFVLSLICVAQSILCKADEQCTMC